MKSKLIQEATYIKDKENYSDLMVLHRGNGMYFIGTIYTDPETGFQEPGSRDSVYMTRDQAEYCLDTLVSSGYGPWNAGAWLTKPG